MKTKPEIGIIQGFKSSLAAAELGRIGGSVTGSRLSPQQRINRASKGGLAAWKKHGPKIKPVDLDRDREFLKILDERELEIILDRFGDNPKTLAEIAKTMGVTRQRVHQLKNSGIAKIKKAKNLSMIKKAELLAKMAENARAE